MRNNSEGHSRYALPLTLAGVLAASAALTLTTGCVDTPGATTPEPPAVSASPAPTAAPAAPPVKLAVMNDKTGSAGETRTAQLTAADLEPLFDTLRARGGELGFGLVTDDSYRSLLRLRLEAPPAPPLAPSQEGNTFEVAERMDGYHAARDDYDRKAKAREEAAARRIEEFRSAAAELLARKPDAPRSDVWGALQRADLFLSEEDSGWPQPPALFVILVSDAQDNVKRPHSPLRSRARVLVVNGSASVGSLSSLSPLLFESPAAAWRYVAAEGGGK